MAIYSYIPVEGPFGHGFNPTLVGSETPATIEYTEIGIADNVHYIEIPEGVTIPEQAEDIQFTVAELPASLEDAYANIQDTRELKELEKAEKEMLSKIAELKSGFLQAQMLGNTEEALELSAELKTLLGVE